MLLIESGFKKVVEFLATQIMLFGKTKTCRCLDDFSFPLQAYTSAVNSNINYDCEILGKLRLSLSSVGSLINWQLVFNSKYVALVYKNPTHCFCSNITSCHFLRPPRDP